MERVKKFILIGICILLLGAIPIGIYLVGQNQEIRKKAAPATTLAITPATVQKNIGDAFSMEVTIDTGENQVVAAELHLIYDPIKLEMETISNGALFPNILASGSIEAGTASITVGAADVKQPIKGSGTVAVIRLKAIAKTDSPTAVKLASNTFVGGLGEGAINVLAGTTPAIVTITEVQSQTMTPPPAEGLTPTLTPTPTSTASAQNPSPDSPVGSLAIVAPTNESTATDNKPVIHGKAAPGTTVTVTIYSTPYTVTVTADASGNWTYTPDTALESGPHNIVASITDQSGQTQTATSAFVVASSEVQSGGATAENPIPVSGTVETTLLLILIGSLFVATGLYWSNWSH